MILQDLGRPDAELRAPQGVDPVADGEDGIQVDAPVFSYPFARALLTMSSTITMVSPACAFTT